MSPARQNPCKHGFFRYFRIAEDFMTPHANPVLHCRYATRKPGPPIRRFKALVRIAKNKDGGRHESFTSPEGTSKNRE